jgi:hypothetical protein
MFKIIQTPEFTHAVPVQVPADGGHREEVLKARFRVLSGEGCDVFALKTNEDITGFLARAVVGLEDIVDEAGAPVPYCDAVRDQVLALPYARAALLRAYIAAVTKARTGN